MSKDNTRLNRINEELKKENNKLKNFYFNVICL